MTTLSHQDQIAARAFFAENRDVFNDWVTSKDTSTSHFAGAAEAAAVFVALCSAVKTLADAMDSIDKVTKHTKTLMKFANDLFSGKEKSKEAKPLSLSERLLVLIFDGYMRSGKGVTTERLVSLTGANQENATAELARFEKDGILRLGKSGWLPVY